MALKRFHVRGPGDEHAHSVVAGNYTAALVGYESDRGRKLEAGDELDVVAVDGLGRPADQVLTIWVVRDGAALRLHEEVPEDQIAALRRLECAT